MDFVRKNKKDLLYYFTIAMLYFSAYVFIYQRLNFYALYVAIPLLFLSYMIKGLFFSNTEFKILLVCYIWFVVCSFFANDVDLSIQELSRVLGVSLLCLIITSFEKYYRNVLPLYFLPIISLISIWIYARDHLVVNIEFGSDRLGDDVINANLFAYLTFYVTHSIYILGIFLESKIKKVFRIVFFFLLPLILFTAMYTGSRQMLYTSLPLFFAYLFIRYMKNSTSINKVLFLIIMGFIYLFFINYWTNMYEGSVLQIRNESLAGDERLILFHDALQIGMDNPIFGVGPANTILFTSLHSMAHNSYLEIFADTGVVGLILFASLVLHFIVVQMKRYLRTHNNLFLSFFIFGVMWSIAQIFYVYYSSLWLMSFFICVSVHSDFLYSKVLKGHYRSEKV